MEFCSKRYTELCENIEDLREKNGKQNHYYKITAILLNCDYLSKNLLKTV